MRKVGTTQVPPFLKGTNLRVNALFRYECAPSFRNLPTLCILYKTVPLMWRAKCPIKAWRCPFAHFVSSLYNCAPCRGKQKFAGTISRFRHRYKGPNTWRAKFPIKHKCAPLPTLCLLYVTVPRNGPKKAQLGTKILRKSVLFLNKEGACFALKLTLLT